MNIAFAVVLLLMPILEGAQSPHLHAGPWPAGVLLAAASRIAERPVVPETTTTGNRTVILPRDLTVTRAALPEILSLLLDAGIVLVELTPEEPRKGWLATNRLNSGHRTIPIEIEVIELRHADAEIVAEMLNAQAATRESKVSPEESVTKFIPDPRTQSVVVRFTSKRFLKEYLALVRELDTPVGIPRTKPVLRSYRPNWVHASILAVQFETEWRKIGGHALRVVAAPDQNLLLIRCPQQSWTGIEEVLQKLDQGSR